MDDQALTKLKELASLKDSGVLTEEEFAQQKAALLSGAVGAQVAVPVGVPEMSHAMQRQPGGESQYERERPRGAPRIPAGWLAGSWTKNSDNCCDPYFHGTVTAMGDNSFHFSLNNETFTPDGGTGGHVWISTGPRHDGEVFKLTVFDENHFNMAWTKHTYPSGHPFIFDFYKDVKTSYAKQGMAPVPEAMAS